MRTATLSFVCSCTFGLAACGVAAVGAGDAQSPDASTVDADPASPDAALADGGDADAGGCQPNPAFTQGLFEDRALSHAGLTRAFDLYVPAQRSARPPLVLEFHGYNADENQQAELSNFRAKAETEGFIVIAPRGRESLNGQTDQGPGTGYSWGAGECCPSANTDQGEPDDPGFVRDIITWAQDNLCIDDHRIYATGISNGAFMASRLGCEMPELIAAIAPVSGGARVQWTECAGYTTEAACTTANDDCVWDQGTCARRFTVGSTLTRTLPADGWSYACPATQTGMPTLLIHGTADKLVPVAGELTPWGRYPSLLENLAHWREVNRCADVVTSTTTYLCPQVTNCGTAQTQVACRRIAGCAYDSGVCHSACDQVGQCLPNAGEPRSALTTCIRHDETACASDAHCHWQAPPSNDPRDLICTRYDQCAQGDVLFCKNVGGGHCWPGSGQCSAAEDQGQRVSATDLIWDYFARHVRP